MNRLIAIPVLVTFVTAASRPAVAGPPTSQPVASPAPASRPARSRWVADPAIPRSVMEARIRDLEADAQYHQSRADLYLLALFGGTLISGALVFGSGCMDGFFDFSLTTTSPPVHSCNRWLVYGGIGVAAGALVFASIGGYKHGRKARADEEEAHGLRLFLGIAPGVSTSGPGAAFSVAGRF